MIRSKYFWTGALLLAVIPLLLLDIPKHYIDWKRDVHDEMIYLAQNTYAYSTAQKAHLLDQVFQSNKSLMALMYLKGFTGFLLLCTGIYFLRKYFIANKNSGWKAIFTCLALLMLVSAIKIYSWTSFTGDQNIKLLSLSPADTALANIYNKNFKGKVVYVDFWGTTCAPCLEEFKNFTKPLEDHYKNRPGIAYLYICSGIRLIWKQQLQKFNLEGSHIFLDKKDYAALYHRSVLGVKDRFVEMPRYLIMDKQGNIADKDAPPPSEQDSVEARLDKYLAQ